jgi:hypothetical protein
MCARSLPTRQRTTSLFGMRVTFGTAAILVAFQLTACLAPPAPPLEPDDFTLAGVPLYPDTVEIRLSFGEPDSVDVGDNPFAVDVPFTTWHYPDFEVRFSGDVAIGYMVSGGAEATLRRIRVGSHADEVRRAYGEPTSSLPSRLTYIDHDDDLGLRVVDFVIADDVVTRIYLGAATP